MSNSPSIEKSVVGCRDIFVGFQVNLAVGQNQWYLFEVGAPPMSVYFSGDWDVHWGYDLAFDPWPSLNLGSSSHPRQGGCSLAPDGSAQNRLGGDKAWPPVLSRCGLGRGMTLPAENAMHETCGPLPVEAITCLPVAA